MSLASVLFSDYHRRLLGLLLLHPDRRYHVREIARLIRATPGAVARELTKLAEAGLLVREPSGNQVLYRADRDCPVFTELASILRKTSGMAEVLANALSPLSDRIFSAFIFGSAAGDTATNGSDVDLLVIGDGLTYGALVDAVYEAQSALGREINPKLYNRAEWRQLTRENGAFFRDIMDKPKIMVMGDKDEPGKPGGDLATGSDNAGHA